MAGQKNQNGKWAGLHRSIICWLKEELEFIDVKIMSYVLAVVLMVSVTAATVAWFLINSTTKVSGLNLTTGSAEDIEISLDDENWVNILEAYSETEGKHGEATTSGIDIAMPAFENIFDENGTKITDQNSGIMAPGTYGEFTFYVKSVNSTYDMCEINIAKVLETAATDNTIPAEVNELLKGHILCFAEVADSGTYTYVSEEQPLELKFQFVDGVCSSQKVKIYWVWPYEYEDLVAKEFKIGSITIGSQESPSKLFALPEDMPQSLGAGVGNTVESDYQLACNQVFEWNRYNNTIAEYLAANDVGQEELRTEWYDYADTLVGSYVANVMFHIGVKGVMSNE